MLSGRVFSVAARTFLSGSTCVLRLLFSLGYSRVALRVLPPPCFYRVSFLSSLRPFSVPADVLNTCSELLFICSSSFGGCGVAADFEFFVDGPLAKVTPH